MKRVRSSDSLGAPLMSMCQNSTDDNHQWSSQVYSRDFQSMLELGLVDEEPCVEESGGGGSEKKRRLRVDQVKALEKNFEVENKLEPERKVKLAQELGLQPRQVAVWFQNRRARWKTKNLERDYNILKANFDSLKHNYESLQHHNEALLKEIHELKSKLNGGNIESKVTVKEEETESETHDDIKQSKPNNTTNFLGKCENEDDDDDEDDNNNNTELNFDSFNGENENGIPIFTAAVDNFKDGSSDSDSSAILNEETFLISNSSSSTNSSLNCFQFMDSNPKSILGDAHYQTQFVKMEEHNFFSGEESCTTLFSDEQAPSLHWYYPEEDWNWKES